MFLIPHLLCLLLGLLALDTVHASPLTEVQLQQETLAPDTVHAAASAEVQLQNETLLVLDIQHAASSAEVKLQRGSCPMFWFSFNGRCYKYVATDYTWADAEWNCASEDQDANLVSIYSVEEHNFVRNLIKNFDPVEGPTWIGMTDIHKEGRWMWSDGCKVAFTAWYDREPNNSGGNEDCVEMNYNTKWNDRPCSQTWHSVCASRTMCP